MRSTIQAICQTMKWTINNKLETINKQWYEQYFKQWTIPENNTQYTSTIRTIDQQCLQQYTQWSQWCKQYVKQWNELCDNVSNNKHNIVMEENNIAKMNTLLSTILLQYCHD